MSRAANEDSTRHLPVHFIRPARSLDLTDKVHNAISEIFYERDRNTAVNNIQ